MLLVLQTVMSWALRKEMRLGLLLVQMKVPRMEMLWGSQSGLPWATQMAKQWGPMSVKPTELPWGSQSVTL